MARYRLKNAHFRSSYHRPYLVESGDTITLPYGQWPASIDLWDPMDTDAKARQAAQAGYTRILQECRTPMARDADELTRQASERPATRAAQIGRRLIYEQLLKSAGQPATRASKGAPARPAGLRLDASVAPALDYLEQNPQREGSLKDGTRAQGLELAEEIVLEVLEGRIPNAEEPLPDGEEGPEDGRADVSERYDPMTDRRTVHPSQTRDADRELAASRDRGEIDVESNTISETWEDAAAAQARAHEAAKPRRRSHPAERASDKEL